MLHIWSKYYNVIIWHYNNIVITLTHIQAFCTLRTPFDIVFNALFNHGSHPKRPFQTYMFLQICSYLGSKVSPDMILSAFDIKFHETKNEILSLACRPPNKFKKIKNKTHLEMGVRVASAWAGGPGGAAPWEEEKRGVRGAAPPG